MRRLIIVLLIIAVCVSPLNSVLGDDLSTNDVNQPKQTVVNYWDNLLEVVSTQNTIIIWALDQIDSFVQEPTWNNLNSARVACMTARMEVAGLSWPVNDISSQQIAILKSQGITIESYETYYSMDYIPQSFSFVEILHEVLETNWYSKQGQQTLQKLSTEWRRLLQQQTLYLGYLTNYLYLQIFPDNETAKEMARRWDNAYVTMWCSDISDLPGLRDIYTKSYESAYQEYTDAYNSVLTMSYTIRESISIVDVTGLPVLLPYPEWLPFQEITITYFIREENGDISFPSSTGDIGNVSELMTFYCVDQQDIDSWIQQIKPYVESVKQTDDLKWLISVDGYEISVILFENDTAYVVISGQLCPFVDGQYLQETGMWLE